MAVMNNGDGYWLAASDGQVYAFGDARLYGQRTQGTVTSKVVSIRATPDGRGYWLFLSNGLHVGYGDAG